MADKVHRATGQYSKHYYTGSERIASRIAGQASVFEHGGSHAPQQMSGEMTISLRENQYSDLDIITAFMGEEGVAQPQTTTTFNNAPPVLTDCSQYPQGSEARKHCECAQDPSACSNILYFYHPDHLGSSSFMTDISGNTYEFMLYLPYGELMVQQKAAEFSTPYKFTSKELDEETGLYYFGARYYDARIDTCHAVDNFAAKYPNMSPYNYVANNPINNIDIKVIVLHQLEEISICKLV